MYEGKIAIWQDCLSADLHATKQRWDLILQTLFMSVFCKLFILHLDTNLNVITAVLGFWSTLLTADFVSVFSYNGMKKIYAVKSTVRWERHDLKTLQDPLLQMSIILHGLPQSVIVKSGNCCSNCGTPITRSLVVSGFINSELWQHHLQIWLLRSQLTAETAIRSPLV